MSSYYNRIEGTLNTGQTARSSDIHLIQSGIQDAFQRALIDICGTGIVLGETEDALKLYPTTQTIDQSNPFELADENQPGLSFYETYFRQPINIEKSSIESINLQLLNSSNIEVTIYGEIRDADFDLVGETNTILPPTQDEYKTISFTFNLDHLPLGRYYFILRPVDISAIDLTKNGDESLYDTITENMFRVKYDSEGSYSNIEDDDDGIVTDDAILYNDDIGLFASYDGNEYLEAKYLINMLSTEQSTNTIAPEKNFDLCFEHVFSSGNTYLINNGGAIVLGEKVYPLDTHVTIDGPSTNGDRTDLVILTTDGQLNVIKGTIYNGEKVYPIDNTGLKIAYITSFKSTGPNNTRVPAIEQDDNNNMTRQRDILERLRRLEKKLDYQANNNSPTRIKFTCNVDPILANNGVNEDAELRGEGTYGIGEGTTSDGSTAAVSGNIATYSWSIIKNNYSYNYAKTASQTTGKLIVYDVHMPVTKPKNIQSYMRCKIEIKDSQSSSAHGVPYQKVNVIIKKNSNVIGTYNVQTDNSGVYNLSLWNIKKLKAGTYHIYVKYNNKTVKANMKVYADNHSFNNITPKPHQVDVQIKTVTAAQATQKLPSTIITGDDSFYRENVDIDVDKGEVTIKKVQNTGEYEKNKLLKDMKVFSSVENVYKLKSDKVALTSEYPVLNFTLESDTHIKNITPYIAGFKNLDKFGILIFKNDFVFNKTKNTRKIIQKKIAKKDTIFPTVYNSGWHSLKDLAKQKNGYKAPKKQTTFNVKKDFEAGTYSLVIYGHIAKGQTEGAIKLKEYVTRDYRKDYGIATKCTGGSKLSVINMDTSNLTNKSWDVLIEQRPYKYHDSGILISKSIETAYNIDVCRVKRNFKIPSGCNINLYVSNNGGTSWQSINSDSDIKFNGNGHAFKWKLEMTSTSTSTPKLCYNEAWKYAIRFTLGETASYVPYEDFQRCYETPLLNANTITRQYVANNLIKHRFSEWEFARLYIEDEELKSKIDILISYADEDTTTYMSTDKSQWHHDIFFSQIFADLTLNDFSRESVDYDDYSGNVEYDEYNYPFKMESEYIMQENSGKALASPDVYYNNPESSPYMYGDIGAVGDDGLSFNEISKNFMYEYKESEYTYKDNADDSTKKYSGMHITNGPVWLAKLTTGTPTYTKDDIIIGVRFNDILEIDETITDITLGIKPLIDESTEREDDDHYEGNVNVNDSNQEEVEKQYFFPPDTFEVVVAVNKYGEANELDATNGKIYNINKKLIANEYNEVTISFINEDNDLESFAASGIGSIGIRAKDPDNALKEGEGLGLGRIITTSSKGNIRGYVPYMYSGKWSRLSWQTLQNKKEKAYGMYELGRKNATTSSKLKVFYPITNYDKKAINSTIKFQTGDDSGITASYKVESKDDSGAKIYEDVDDVDITTDNINKGSLLYIWSSQGTSRAPNATYSNTSSTGQVKSTIKRKGHEITTSISVGGKKAVYKTTDTGNQTLFYMPKDVTGELFKIETNIPYTIYDLIDIEYYVFTTYVSGESTTTSTSNVLAHTGTGRTYTTHGHFSKGDIYINFYDTTDTNNASPVESFALPAWGRIQTRSYVENKVVHSWFKTRSDAPFIKAITIERKNPRKNEGGNNAIGVDDLYLILNNIILFNAEKEAALGPQMQMRIYPNSVDNLGPNTKIRKIGGIYRI